MSVFPRLVMLAVVVLCTGCASVPLEQARSAYYQGDYADAIEILSSKEIRSRDRLLALMEKGLIQHEAGAYEDSIKTFMRAYDFLQERDYISVGEQSASLAVNDWVTTYKGEYAERLWIHTFQMMNFLLLEKFEGAAVEARRALQVFADHPKTLAGDYFTRALAGLSFDSVGLSNDAYIEYLNLAESLPNPGVIAPLLAQRARQIGLPAVAKKYAALSEDSLLEVRDQPDQAEIVIFIHSGDLPRKIPGDLFLDLDKRISFPLYASDTSPAPELSLTINDRSHNLQTVSTDLAEVAQNSLKARGKKIAAKQIARLGVKNAIVDSVKSESESAAQVLDAVFFLLEEADTRSWSTLPGRLQLLRIPLDAGSYDLQLSVPAGSAQGMSSLLSLDNLDIRAGQRVFRTLRMRN